MYRIINYTLIITVLLGCVEKKDSSMNSKFKTYTVDESSSSEFFDLINVFSSVDIIPLKFDKGNIGTINHVIYRDNEFYVHDSSVDQILIFDKFGNYLNRIFEQGPGPKQYGRISFFDLNIPNKSIDIFNVKTGKVISYSFDGQFKEKNNLRMLCRDFAVTKNGNYLCYAPDETIESQGKNYNPGIFIADKKGEILDFVPLGSTSYIPMLAGKSIISYNENHYLFSHYVDTIYSVVEDKIENSLTLDFQNKLESSVFTNSNYDYDKLKTPFLKINPFMTSKYFGFTFLLKNKMRFLSINKKTTDYQIGRKLSINKNLKYLSFNGNQASDNTFITILNDETLLFMKEYLEKAPGLEKDIDEVSHLLESNNGNPLLVVGYFNEEN